ncbi:hypothetical protein RV18_GL000201 [Enterococcus termitis]|nr:hypothetical protein RV18_GL000201 [Enterococcus termitis]
MRKKCVSINFPIFPVRAKQAYSAFAENHAKKYNEVMSCY